MGIPKDMVGRKYGRVFVVSLSDKPDTTRRAMWNCLCDCGNEFITAGVLLRRGATKSCGCLNDEKRILTCKSRAIHNMSKTSSEYNTWLAMKARCYNPNNRAYADYGGRGIEICSEWMASFECFLSDMGNKPSPAHSLDRINVNGNYKPINCRWATIIEQANNKRGSKRYMEALQNKIIALESENKSLRQLLETKKSRK